MLKARTTTEKKDTVLFVLNENTLGIICFLNMGEVTLNNISIGTSIYVRLVGNRFEIGIIY